MKAQAHSEAGAHRPSDIAPSQPGSCILLPPALLQRQKQARPAARGPELWFGKPGDSGGWEEGRGQRGVEEKY